MVLYTVGSTIQHLNNWGQVPLASCCPKVDSTVHQINHYPLKNAIGFPNLCFTYPLDGDLTRSVVQRVDKVILWIVIFLVLLRLLKAGLR